MGSYFWNSGPQPPVTAPGGTPTPQPFHLGGGGGRWGNPWGGYSGPPVSGGPTPPTLSPFAQSLVNGMSGPGDGLHFGQFTPASFWAALTGSASGAPATSGLTTAGLHTAGAGPGYSTSGMSHSPLTNPTGSSTATGMGPYPNPPGSPPGGPTPFPPQQDGPHPVPMGANPAVLNAYWQYIQNRWPGGWNNGPPGPFRLGG